MTGLALIVQEVLVVLTGLTVGGREITGLAVAGTFQTFLS
jgi:hypothetical protein